MAYKRRHPSKLQYLSINKTLASFSTHPKLYNHPDISYRTQKQRAFSGLLAFRNVK